jgi:hypothetical protein
MSGRRCLLVAVAAVLATVAQSITVMCDAASLFTESRGLFMATSNATAFDREFALALHKHCWPSLTADGQEGIVHATVDADSWETKLDQHLYDLHDRLHELNQLLVEKMSDKVVDEESHDHEDEGESHDHEDEDHEDGSHEDESHEDESHEDESHEDEDHVLEDEGESHDHEDEGHVLEDEGHDHEAEGHAVEEENTSWDREMEAGKIVPE